MWTDETAGRPEGPASLGAEGIVLPHRAAAVLVLAGIAVGCLALAAGGWLALWSGVVVAEDPEGELVTMLSAGLLVGCLAFIVAAWTMGAGDLRRMAAGRMDPAGRWRTRAGLWVVRLIVLGAVGCGLAVLAIWLIDLWQTYVLIRH